MDTKQKNKMNKIKIMLLLVTVCSFVGNVAGQTVKVEESQTRLIEPKQDVLIVPLVAEIQLNSQTRQDFGPYEFDIVLDSPTTFEQISNAWKANSLYRATREADADVLVAATFNVKLNVKEKKVIVNVSGYPGKYINFRSLKFDKKEDYEWIQVVYPATWGSFEKSAEKEKAVK